MAQSDIRGGGGQSCLLRKHVGPLGGCPVCQMSSPALFQRKAFTGENGTGSDRSRPECDRSGDHTERIPRSLSN